MAPVDRQDITDRVRQAALEDAGEARPLFLAFELAVEGIDVHGELALAADIVPRVLVSGPRHLRIDGEPPRQRPDEALRLGRPEAVILVLAGEEFAVGPDGVAVAAPEYGERPARQAFAGIPFALPEMQEAARRITRGELGHQRSGEPALVGSERGRVPFRAVAVVDRDEGRLAAHGETHVAGYEVAIDGLAERVDAPPFRVAIGLGRPGLLGQADDIHRMGEGDLAGLDAA